LVRVYLLQGLHGRVRARVRRRDDRVNAMFLEA
jgi:hypothetical protein